MPTMANANIMKLVFKNITSPQKILTEIRNKTLYNVILRTTDYDKIYKSMGKSKVPLLGCKADYPKITLLSNDNAATACWDGKLKIFDTKNYKCIKTVEGVTEIQSMVTLSNNNIAVCASHHIKVFDTSRDYECIKTISVKYDRLFVLSNGDLASKAYINQYSIVIYHHDTDYDSFKELAEAEDGFMCITSISKCNVAVGSYKSLLIYIYDIEDDYKCLKKLSGHKDWILDIVFDNRNKLLISGSNDGVINIWNESEFSCIKTIATSKAIYFLLLLANGYFASGGRDGVKIYNLKDYETVKHIDECSTNCLKQLKDNRIISVTRNDGTITIWNYI
jgi:WD40 repeat protein